MAEPVGHLIALVSLFTTFAMALDDLMAVTAFNCASTAHPLLAFFFRNRPEDIGQVPDGVSSPSAEPDVTVQRELTWGLTLKDALRTRSYWILMAMHMT